MEKSYKEEYVIKCFEVDAMKHLKAFAFMNMAQELGHIHSTKMGCGYKDLIINDNVWIIYRAHVKFLSAPKWEDRVTLETWHKCNIGLFSIRDFEMCDMNGTPLIEATTSWLIMNMKTRHVLRTDHVLPVDKFAPLSFPEKNIIRETCPKIEIAEEATFVKTRVVGPSDVDYNLHLNNAKYLEWVMDCLDIELLKSHAIDEFFINYESESQIGDPIDLYTCKLSESEYYVDGRRAGKHLFKLTIKFKL